MTKHPEDSAPGISAAGETPTGMSAADASLSGEMPSGEHVLLTGFPGFVARRMATRILALDPEAVLVLLVGEAELDAVQALVAALPEAQAARVRPVLGEVGAMDLGMAGHEYQALVASVTVIHHMAGLQDMSIEPAAARRVNVEGTREVLQMAAGCKRLRRLCHWSTAAVAGKRKGVVLEEELDEGQSFHNAYEETRFEAEKLVRSAQRRLPVTVLRPGIIVGDSQTGEIDKLDGPYYLIFLIVHNATQVNLPLPGRGTAPLHVVPVDYVVDAAHALAGDERAAGKTLHLTDPNPLSARRIYELVAEHSHTRPPRGFIPGGLTRTLLRAPGLDRLVRAPRAFMDSFDHQVFYNSRHAQALLADAGVRCPPFDSYVENLVRYVRQRQQERRQARDEADADVDPYE